VSPDLRFSLLSWGMRQVCRDKTDLVCGIGELVGGEDKLDQSLFTRSGDSLIINVGSEHWRTNEQHPRDAGNW